MSLFCLYIIIQTTSIHIIGSRYIKWNKVLPNSFWVDNRRTLLIICKFFQQFEISNKRKISKRFYGKFHPLIFPQKAPSPSESVKGLFSRIFFISLIYFMTSDAICHRVISQIFGDKEYSGFYGKAKSKKSFVQNIIKLPGPPLVALLGSNFQTQTNHVN